MTRRIAFKTLGCRLNQFETDALVTDFHNAGYKVVNFTDEADVYVVNTCTVTNQSDKKSKYEINHALKTGGQDALVVVTGCMATGQKEYLESRDDITYVVDNKRKGSVLPLVEGHFRGEILHPADMQQDLFNFSVVEKGFHTRSAVKIQDGCDNFCTFCIVPKVRGRATSRPVADVLDNVKRSVELGNHEIVLTGVNISRYEHEGTKFEDLVEQILDIPGDFRVRISSIEPEGFTERFVELFQHQKLCPHLHLCLQSGSDKVLLRMRRFYTIEQYMGIVELFRRRFPLFNFTTDVIVGFPGETEEEFAETCEIIKEVGFSHIHTFKYSKRTGTRAERMDDQVQERIKNERSAVVRALAEEQKLQYRRQFLGKTQRLLVERNSTRHISKGYGESYLPLQVKKANFTPNQFYNVRITDVLDNKDRSILAEPV